MKNGTIGKLFLTGFWGCALAWNTGAALAQGQDSTPGERNLLIISELLPGIYSNANQALFDARRQVSDENRHARKEFRIARIAGGAGGEHVFSLEGDVGGETVNYRMSLNPGPDDMELSATLSRETGGNWQAIEDCALVFRRRADHYDSRARGEGCAATGIAGMQVSRNEIWIQSDAKPEPYWYERAREFHCYADLPGVSGGRDIPFERYDDIILHDKGATHWFTTRDETKRQIGLTLQAITWHVLNENNGNFNRNSLVLYASEKMEDGSVKSHPYTFTQPDAERIGYNLRWMLVNCAITPRDKARPEM